MPENKTESTEPKTMKQLIADVRDAAAAMRAHTNDAPLARFCGAIEALFARESGDSYELVAPVTVAPVTPES